MDSAQHPIDCILCSGYQGKRKCHQHSGDPQSEASTPHLLPPGDVRSQLYNTEPKLAIIGTPAAALIGATSTLFLQSLVDRASATSGSEGMIKASNVSKIACETEAFAFLREPLDAIPPTMKEYRKRQKRENLSGPAPKRAAKSARLGGTSELGGGQLPAVDVDSLSAAAAAAAASTSDQIVADDDEYDF